MKNDLTIGVDPGYEVEGHTVWVMVDGAGRMVAIEDSKPSVIRTTGEGAANDDEEPCHVRPYECTTQRPCGCCAVCYA